MEPASPKLTNLRALLFDMDGTLVDTDPVHVEVWKKMLEPLGIVVDKEYFRTHISGGHNVELIRRYFGADMPEDEAMRIGEEKEAQFRQLAEEKNMMHPINGLVGLLEQAVAVGLPMMCVTNAPRSNAEWMLRVLKLPQYFGGIVIGDECTRPKPFPDPYLEALNRLGVSAKNTIVFEDSPTGIRSAVEAGCTVVGIATSQPHQVLIQSGCKLVVDNYADLTLEKLDSLLN